MVLRAMLVLAGAGTASLVFVVGLAAWAYNLWRRT